MITITLNADQIGKQSVALTDAQLASIDAQRAGTPAQPPASGGSTQRRTGGGGTTTTVTPPAGGNASGPTKFLAARVQLPDAQFLYRMDYDYRQQLRNLPGAHQVFFDMLTDANGRTWSDGVPQPTGTVNDANLKTAINRLINLAGAEHAAETTRFDVNAYAGPLKAIYANLVAAKLAGKA